MKNAFKLLACTMFVLWCSNGYANTGVFYGAGNQVIPIKNDAIRLINENVSIKFRVEPDNGKYGIPFFPWADVVADFSLINESDKLQSLELGFPFLSLQGFGDEDFVLKNLDFKASTDKKDFVVTLKEGSIEKELDPEGLYKKVFTWPTTFAAGESNKLSVSYHLLVGGAAYRNRITDTDNIIGWAYKLFYITKTAYTWKPSIDKAVFSIDTRSVSSQLVKPSVLSAFSKGNKDNSGCIIYSQIMPKGYTASGGVFRWEFEKKVPKEGLAMDIIILNVPSDNGELQKMLNIKKAKMTRQNFRKYLDALIKLYKNALSNELIYPSKTDIESLIKTTAKSKYQ